MPRFLILTLFVALPVWALDYEEPPFDEFFKIEENKAMYKTIVETGKLQEAKDQMVAICKKWSTEKANLDEACKCAKKELATLSDEMLFYSSMTAYRRYQAKVEALKNDDKERFEALKKHFAANPLMQDGFGERLEAKCLVREDASDRAGLGENEQTSSHF